MVGSTYVSDPEVWRTFYRKMLQGNVQPIKMVQKTSGISGMYHKKKKTYMLVINEKANNNAEPSIPLVTPMHAVLERVKSEYQRDVEMGFPHVPSVQRGGGQKRKRHDIDDDTDSIQEKPSSTFHKRTFDSHWMTFCK